MDALLETPGLLPASVMVCLLIGSGFFSSSETSLFFLSSDELQAFQRSGRTSERRVVELLHDPDRLLTAVLFWNLVINLSFFACGIVISERMLREGYRASAAAFGVGSLSLMILFGEVLPKSVAVMFRQSMARRVSLPLMIAVWLFDPLAPMLRTVTRSLRRMFWPAIKKETYLSARDLEQAIDNSAGNKSVIRQERLVLHNILDLSEIPIEEAMRPRGTYPAMIPPVSFEDIPNAATSSDYIVVLDDNGDDVNGALPLTRYSRLSRENLEDSAEPVFHAPWCATVASVLHQMESSGCSLASVVNEYGETVGVVTYEDIVDTILAPEPSRAKRVLRREPVVNVAPDEWHVDGITSLRYLSRRLRFPYEPETDGQVTVTGVFHEILQRIPDVGDECIWSGFRFRVFESTKRGHFRVHVTREAHGASGSGRSES